MSEKAETLELSDWSSYVVTPAPKDDCRLQCIRGFVRCNASLLAGKLPTPLPSGRSYVLHSRSGVVRLTHAPETLVQRLERVPRWAEELLALRARLAKEVQQFQARDRDGTVVVVVRGARGADVARAVCNALSAVPGTRCAFAGIAASESEWYSIPIPSNQAGDGGPQLPLDVEGRTAVVFTGCIEDFYFHPATHGWPQALAVKHMIPSDLIHLVTDPKHGCKVLVIHDAMRSLDAKESAWREKVGLLTTVQVGGGEEGDVLLCTPPDSAFCATWEGSIREAALRGGLAVHRIPHLCVERKEGAITTVVPVTYIRLHRCAVLYSGHKVYGFGYGGSGGDTIVTGISYAALKNVTRVLMVDTDVPLI